MAESGKQLHAAAKEGRLEDLGALLKQVEVNWADEDKVGSAGGVLNSNNTNDKNIYMYIHLS